MGGLTKCILDIVLTDGDKTVKDYFRGCYFYTDRGRAGLKDNIAGTFTKEEEESSYPKMGVMLNGLLEKGHLKGMHKNGWYSRTVYLRRYSIFFRKE